MKLLTAAIKNKMPMEVGIKDDTLIIVKFFNPCGAGTWYIVSGYAVDSDYNEIKLSEMKDKEIQEIMLYGYVTGLGCNEWGYVSFNELSSIKIKPFGLGIERDMHYGNLTVKEVLEKNS